MQSDVNRRRAIRRKRARIRHLLVAFVIFLIIALITLAIMCFTVFFPIKRISVSGSEIYNKKQIIQASKLSTDDNLWVVSEKTIEKNIRKKLPYVDNVELKRVLPDAVVLTITDAKEYAYYQSGEKYYILSDNGYILKEQTEQPQNVFKIVTQGISGKVSDKAVYKNSTEEETVNTLITALNNEKLNIDEIDVSDMINITVKVSGKYVVNLGKNDYANQKIAHLATMIEEIGDRSGMINLSMWTPDDKQGTFVEKTS